MLSIAPKAIVDFETRSTCSLRNCGTWRYSIDPTTDVLCLAFRLPYWPEGETALWHPAFPAIGIEEGAEWDRVVELLLWIQDGELVEAHNAWFEQCIWQHVLAPRYGWQLIPDTQWRDSATKAAAHALPRSLDDLADAIAVKVRKDADGTKVMKKITKPRKPRKKELAAWEAAGRPTLWHESHELFDRLWVYCRYDVLSEEAIGQRLDDLSPDETNVYLLDQKINRRGFQIDADAVSTALTLIEKESAKLNKRLQVITKGKVQKATARAQMLAWFAEQGLHLDDSKGATLDEVLASNGESAFTDLTPVLREGIQIVRTLGRSSTAKYQKMADWMGDDQRVHGGLLYHGASTGRWSGSGVQPHNFPKGRIKNIDEVWDVLKSMNARRILAMKDKDDKPLFTSIIDALSQGLRGAIIAAPGTQLYVADYASIEARVLLWVADDDEALDVFRQGRDIYCEMATAIYKRAITKADAQERQLGKAAVLGCGYQMGGAKFVATAASYGVTIDEEFSADVVNAYRSKFWKVKSLWEDQENAALNALWFRGKPIQCGPVTWLYQGNFLYCTLPSGRRIAYPYPQAIEKEMPWGKMKKVLTFMGVDSYTHQWKRQYTYGGSLVENIVQAISRDIMAEAMLRIEQTGDYRVVLSVHDELIAEADEGVGSVEAFQRLMEECPPWATGCPIAAEGWVGKRYKK